MGATSASRAAAARGTASRAAGPGTARGRRACSPSARGAREAGVRTVPRSSRLCARRSSIRVFLGLRGLHSGAMLCDRAPMTEPILAGDAEESGRVLARAFRDNPGVKIVLAGDGPEDRLRVATPPFIGFVKGPRKYGTAECVKRGGKVV